MPPPLAPSLLLPLLLPALLAGDEVTPPETLPAGAGTAEAVVPRMLFADVGEEEIGDSISPEVEVVAGLPPKIIADEAVEEELPTEAGLEPCAAPRTEEDTACRERREDSSAARRKPIESTFPCKE